MAFGNYQEVALLLLFTTCYCTAQSGPNFLVAAPSVLQIGVKQTVVVSVFKVNTPISVAVRVEDRNGQTLYQAANQNVQDKPVEYRVEVPYEKVPSPEPGKSVRYAFIRAISEAASLSFNKTARVVLTTKSLSVFVQTDKPIYRRNEKVRIRVVAVNSSLLSKDSTEVTVDIKNPQHAIVDRILLKTSSGRGIMRHTIHLGPGSLQGDWTIVARYGYNAESKSEYRFEVRDYVLPRFDVRITPPNYVSAKDLSISFKVTARYTYNKGVVGKLKVQLGIILEGNDKIAIFKEGQFNLSQADNGIKNLVVPNKGYEVFPLGKQMYISAEVLDSSSGVKQSTFDTSAQFTNNPIRLDCSLSPPYYHPNLPLQLKVRATYASGSVVPDVEIEYTSDASVIQTTNKKGIASFVIAVGQASGDKEFQFQVKKPILQQPVTACTLKPFSSSGRYISVQSNFSDGQTPTVGSLGEFQIIRDSNDKRSLTAIVLITSRGTIQQQQTVQMQQAPIAKFQIRITDDLAGKFCLLAYYVEDNNEVVSDALCVQIDNSFKNDIRVWSDYRHHTPGGRMTLNLAASRHSQVALLAVDKSLYFLNNENKLSRDAVFNDLKSYDKSCGYTSVDSKGVFGVAGLTSISNTTLQSSTRESEACPSRRKRDVVKSSNVSDLPRRIRSTSDDDFSFLLSNEIDWIVAKLSYFPHVWLWDEDVYMGDRDEKGIEITVPDLPTEWVVQAIGFSETDGFGVAIPYWLNVNKPVLIECHIPFSFTLLEQTSLHCTVYCYNSFGIKACVSIVRPPESICTTAGRATRSVPQCFNLQSQSTKSIEIPILPLEVGHQNLTILLQTEFVQEEVKYDINVKPNGVLRQVDFSTELDPQSANIASSRLGVSQAHGSTAKGPCFQLLTKAQECTEPLQGSYTKEECCRSEIQSFSVAWGTDCERCPTREEIFRRGVPNALRGRQQETTFYTRLPEDYVASSEKAWLTVSGRYMKGTVVSISNISDHLRQPGGDGEVALINFAPNVEIVKFLKGTDPLLPSDKERQYIDLLTRGYQHLLGYRKSDSGGFAVRQDKNAATWLSAFALRTLCSARHFIDIDDNVIAGVLNFLLKQQESNGTYTEHENVYQREMLGGVQGGDTSLTAFVVVSILQCCNESLKSPEIITSLCKAKDFLVLHMNVGYMRRQYNRAIVYYALAKICISCKACNCDPFILPKIQRLLYENATTTQEGSTYWNVSRQYGQAYWYLHRPSVISTETTAYALCATLSYGDIESARPIVKWLNQQRNSKGAFISTQATVVALHCLSEFSRQSHLKRQLSVSVTALHNASFRHNFEITDTNADVNQRISVPLNDVVRLTTTGDGLGVAQLHVEYNTPSTENEQCRFDFTVSSTPVNSDKSVISIRTCARFLGNGSTNMANIEVELPSGYKACYGSNDERPDQLCLSSVLHTAAAIGLMEYEVSGKTVIFYLDKISSKQSTCLEFRADREYAVVHPLPLAAKVYDYYEPDVQCTKFYELEEGLNLICNNSINAKQPFCLCAAGRCPKLEPISNRLCNACEHHHYVYKITPVEQEELHGWITIRVRIEEVIMPGRIKIKEKQSLKLWLSEACENSFRLELGKYYHLQGRDGPKFVLDHGSQIEEWPLDYDDCIARNRRKCAAAKCKKIPKRKGARKNCENKKKSSSPCRSAAKKACKDTKNFFEDYLPKIRNRNGASCQLKRICN